MFVVLDKNKKKDGVTGATFEAEPIQITIPTKTTNQILETRQNDSQKQTHSVKMSAIPFITFDPDTDRCAVAPTALNLLTNLKGPVAVVVVCGVYRSGKSLLLNKCLLQSPAHKGFGVGNTVSACTKGIWMYSEPIVTADGKKVVVLDAEGAFSLTANRTHDTRVLVLSLLLSSYFIYNSVKSIDSSALQNLSLITQLSQFIQSRNELAGLVPPLLWIVRDFSLRLEDPNGELLTPNQYLENALLSGPHTDPETAKIQQDLKRAFPVRECKTLVRPCDREEDLQHLEELGHAGLRPEFVQGLKELREYILQAVPAKVLGDSQRVDGCALVQLASAYVDAINGGVVPIIEDTWTLVSEKQTSQIIESITQRFQKLMEEVVVTNLTELRSKADAYQKQSLLDFRSVALCRERESVLVEKMEKVYQTTAQYHTQKINSQINSDLLGVYHRLSQDQTLSGVQQTLEQAQADLTSKYGAAEVLSKFWWEKQWDVIGKVCRDEITDLQAQVARGQSTNREQREELDHLGVAVSEKEATVRRLQLACLAEQERVQQQTHELEQGEQERRALAALNSQYLEKQAVLDGLLSKSQQLELDHAAVVEAHEQLKVEYHDHKTTAENDTANLHIELVNWRKLTTETLDQVKQKHVADSELLRQQNTQLKNRCTDMQMALAKTQQEADSKLQSQEQEYNRVTQTNKAQILQLQEQLRLAENSHTHCNSTLSKERQERAQELSRADQTHKEEVRRLQKDFKTAQDLTTRDNAELKQSNRELETKLACSEVRFQNHKRKLQEYENNTNEQKLKEANDALLSSVGSLQTKADWFEKFYKQSQLDLQQSSSVVTKLEQRINNILRTHEVEILRLTLRYEGELSAKK